jgi:hypothetical protein
MTDYSELKRLTQKEFDAAGGDNWPDATGGYFDCRPGDGEQFEYLSALRPAVVLALIAENEELRKNYERYRFLRQYTVDSYLAQGSFDSLDRDIDAAMSEEAGQ